MNQVKELQIGLIEKLPDDLEAGQDPEKYRYKAEKVIHQALTQTGAADVEEAFEKHKILESLKRCDGVLKVDQEAEKYLKKKLDEWVARLGQTPEPLLWVLVGIRKELSKPFKDLNGPEDVEEE